MTQEALARAIERVRHRGLQRRIDARHRNVPKATKTMGADWQPCEICFEEAGLILAEIRAAVAAETPR